MVIEQFSFLLKDGRTAIIRSPKEEDWQNLISFITKATGETDFLLNTPEECSKFTPEFEKAFINSTNDSPYATMILCLVDNQIVGNARIEQLSHLKTKHRATVGIAILRDYWNQGIGSHFFSKLISVAEANPDIKQMELEFVEGNERAKALYEKFGFKITSFRPNSIKAKDGTFKKEFYMIKELDR